MRLYVGTSGYSYKEWKGSFYPEDISAGDMLAYYGARLGAVEVNNTFYRMPKTSVLESWAEAVPRDFRFSIKASQKITHHKRLRDAADPTEYLLKTVRTLEDRLGTVLFQLPPYLKVDAQRLAAFLELVPEDIPAAFEFRHESWVDEAVHGILRDHGAALCCADTDATEEDEPLVSTTGWGYLRLRRPDYGDGDLKRWAERVAGQEWSHAFVFFKHEDEGAGPRMAERFRELFEEAT